MESDEELARRFGQAVAAARKLRGWSQEDLAERLGVSTTHVGFMERGERMPSVGVMVGAARVLGISLDAALGLAKAGHQDELGELAAAVTPAMRPHALALLRSLVRETSAPTTPSSRPPRKKR